MFVLGHHMSLLGVRGASTRTPTPTTYHLRCSLLLLTTAYLFYLPPPTYYQLPTTNYQLPSTDYELPTTNYQLPSTDDQLPTTNRPPTIYYYHLLPPTTSYCGLLTLIAHCLLPPIAPYYYHLLPSTTSYYGKQPFLQCIWCFFASDTPAAVTLAPLPSPSLSSSWASSAGLPPSPSPRCR